MVFRPVIISFKYSTKYGLDKVWSSEEHSWTCLAPKFQWQYALGDAVDGSISQTHATSNSTLQHAFTGKCKHLMLSTFRGWTGHYYNNQRELRVKISNCWFELATMWRQIWGNDHLSCRFGLRRSHSAFKGALFKVGNKIGKAEFPSHLKITEYNIYTSLPYQVIKWSLFLKTYT